MHVKNINLSLNSCEQKYEFLTKPSTVVMFYYLDIEDLNVRNVCSKCETYLYACVCGAWHVHKTG